MRAPIALAVVAVFLAACSPPREPVPITPSSEKAGAPVVRSETPAEPAGPPIAMAPPSGSIVPSRPVPAEPAVTLPDGAIYVCVSEKDGQRTQTVIEFVPKVHALCKRHPEMGPCQYERDICRRAGGRVYAAGGQEITLATEAEYDKKVMRVRFRSN